MSAPRSGRALWTQLFRNFLNSFKVKKTQERGNYVGEDLFGNKYYENPADPSIGMRRPRRSFEPSKEMHFDVSNMSAEWDAWLRNRRKDPPTIEELMRNQQIAQMKREKGEKFIGTQKHAEMNEYPRYDEYEVNPGKGHTKFKPE